MPKTKETSNHPCHFLSLPSAKRFWCRHCMSVFEDAITRWRHSRSCRYGVVNNFMRRRQLEAKALQNTTKPNPIEARLEQSVSPSEEPILEEAVQGAASSSGEKSNQATSNDLFRCFICHNIFSTLEEMRHHVKYPCNNKKIVTDVPNPAMTVYIDEFTDRSRQWEPQPQQEEVVSSEFVPNIVSQETVQCTVDGNNVIQQEHTVTLPQNKPNSITPTNIYVNEQGETVIEVENLDLNSEGGELSLAHLLTQLSQQGIVFDKTKASQMQAHHETTVSDPTSGEIYATGTSFDHSASTQTVMKDEDEGQSAEDAANTLAQLAIFRGYRTNPEAYEGTHMSTDLQREYVVEQSSEGYTYTESFAIPSSSSSDQLTVSTAGSHPNFKVEYEYNYLPSSQSTAEVSTTPHISLQSGILDSASAHLSAMEVGKEHDGVQSVSTVNVPSGIQSQVMTYISPTSSTAQQTQTTEEEETMMIEDFVVENSSSTTDPPQQYHVNISDGVIRHNETHQTSIPTVLEGNQNSYIVFSADDNSTQIICPPESQNELTIGPNSVSESILNNVVVSTNNHHHHEHYIQTSNDIRESMTEVKDTEEFEVQTMTLQEIAEGESTGTVSFVQNHSSLGSEPTGNVAVTASNDNNHQANPSGDHCIQLNILQHQNQTVNNIIATEGDFTVAVEHQQQPQEESVSSADTSSVPVYVVGPHGGLQLMTSSQDGIQTHPQEHIVIPSDGSQT